MLHLIEETIYDLFRIFLVEIIVVFREFINFFFWNIYIFNCIVIKWIYYVCIFLWRDLTNIVVVQERSIE